MGRHAPQLDLTAAERDELERRIRARTSSQQAALLARVVLRAAAGESRTAIAAALGIARHTAQHWRDRFRAERLDGLSDRPHHPPPRRYEPQSRRRSSRLPVRSRPTWDGEGKAIGRSLIWRPTLASIRSWGWGHPRRARSARFSRRLLAAWTVFASWMEERDPQFVEKAVAIIGLEGVQKS